MIISASIKPGSKRGPLVCVEPDGTLLLIVREPAQDGKANKAAIELLAEHLGVPKGRVKLVSGASSRHKRFEISD